MEVCAVVVNWNGWRDTLVCVDSLLRQEGVPLRVLVVDNGSTNDSVPQLQQALDPSVRLLPLGRNLGYAGGLNAGIAWAQAQWQARCFWLLNNDVKAEPGALRALVDAHGSVADAGLCGSVLLDWDSPHGLQAVAGIYRRWLGVGRHLRELPASDAASFEAFDYPVGASIYVTQNYLERVGLMDDSYFLYYEEMDWVERGRRQGFRPLVALHSRLWHREGASTGSHGGVRRLSLLSERYSAINRLRITRKFWPHLLPGVWLSLFLVIVDRLVHREFARARLVLRLMFSPRLWL